jgi:hypothetical protein
MTYDLPWNVIYHLFLNMSNTMDSTSRGGTVYDYPCGALESTPVFSGGCEAQSLILLCIVLWSIVSLLVQIILNFCHITSLCSQVMTQH